MHALVGKTLMGCNKDPWTFVSLPSSEEVVQLNGVCSGGSEELERGFFDIRRLAVAWTSRRLAGLCLI